MDENPYAAPKVELIEARTPNAFPGGRWSPGNLRLLAWLSLALLLAQGVLFALSFLGGMQQGDPLDRYSLWLGVLCTLLGCFLSWRATQFLVDRFGARGMAWPLWLSIGLALVIQAYAVLFDTQLDGTPNAELAGFMAMFLPSGLVGLWYGVRVLKIGLPYPSVKVLGWLDVLSGVCMASILLFIPGTLLSAVALLPLALMFLRGARELATGAAQAS
ncbi:hypothetical protein [Pseudomonas knackmussii]|uniref:hypothetical protein n=1 Tax=Pseudomonas knackmussii TaxID=65741 RepID=UPI0013631A17|nr:hypothetical protein [Pseudomonas knackmussii]